MKQVYCQKYKNGAILVFVGRGPKKMPADVISYTFWKKGEPVDVQRLTPDEAMSLAIGLLKGVDLSMGKSFIKFRKDYK